MKPIFIIPLALAGAAALSNLVIVSARSVDSGKRCYQLASTWSVDRTIGPEIKEMAADGFITTGECNDIHAAMHDRARLEAIRQIKEAK